MAASTEHSPPELVRECFIARQPIFNADRQVHGYELFFRSAASDLYGGGDGDAASSRLLSDALSVFGLPTLTGGTRAFINFTRRVLLDGHAYLLPRENVVIELLECVEPDREVLDACRQLKKDGYVLALDDFLYDPKLEPLVELADLIKVDFRALPPAECRRYGEKFLPRGKILLAEKVESWEEAKEAKAWGYRYLQGFFFCRPEVLAGKELLPSRLSILRLLTELSRADADVEALERIIKQDPPLSLKVLAYLNSAMFGWQYEVASIRRAVLLLGLKNLQRWVSLFAVASLAEGRPFELFRACLVRARFCELVLKQASGPGPEGPASRGSHV